MNPKLTRSTLAAVLAVAAFAPVASAQDITRGSGPGRAIPPSPRRAPTRRPEPPARPAPRSTSPERAPSPSSGITPAATLRYKNANDLYDRNKLDEAIAEYEAAVRISSKFADAWVGLGNAQYDKANLDAALDAWQRAIAIDDSYYQAHTNIANVSYARRDFERAETEYRKVLAIKPNYTDALFGLANALVQLKKYEDALPVFEKTIEASNGKNAEAKATLARLYIQLKNPEKAMLYARQAIAEYGSDSEAAAQSWATLGFIQYAQPDMAGADESFAKAISLCGGCASDDLSQLYYNRSLALEALGNKAEAAKALDQYLRLAPFVTNLAEEQKRLQRLRSGQ